MLRGLYTRHVREALRTPPGLGSEALLSGARPVDFRGPVDGGSADDDPFPSGGHHRPIVLVAAQIHAVEPGTRIRGLFPVAGLYPHLRNVCRPSSPSRDGHAAGARRAAGDSRPRLPAGPRAGAGGPLSPARIGPRNRLHRDDLHGPGVEHDLQLPRQHQGHSTNAPRGRRHSSAFAVAHLPPARGPRSHDRAGLELDDVDGRWLVFPHGDRGLHPQGARLPAARHRLVHERGDPRLQRPGHDRRRGRHGPDDRVCRPGRVAASCRLEPEVQGGGRRRRRRAAFLGARPGPPLHLAPAGPFHVRHVAAFDGRSRFAAEVLEPQFSNEPDGGPHPENHVHNGEIPGARRSRRRGHLGRLVDRQVAGQPPDRRFIPAWRLADGPVGARSVILADDNARSCWARPGRCRPAS